jgi:hypothetical protein
MRKSECQRRNSAKVSKVRTYDKFEQRVDKKAREAFKRPAYQAEVENAN